MKNRRENKIFFLLYILLIVLILLSATVAGGSTGAVREPRHRPLALVAYRTASTREFPPPADWSGLEQT